ncbi:MAG: hypothetical protein ABIF10_07710, partial [Candidatus Woesearchaeota archaeon]
LGIPLIEIGTKADIKTPEHAKEVAEKLGMILRSTGKVKRGIGTIRQDVNTSIKGGARTEIKGFQELKSIPKVIGFEIERQMKLIKEGRKIQKEVRKAESNGTTSFLRPLPGAARMYPETDVIPVIAPADVELSELIEEKAAKYQEKYGLGKDLAVIIAKQKAKSFERFAERYKNLKAPFIAEALVSSPREIKRKHGIEANLSDEQLDKLFNYLDTGILAKESLNEAMLEMAKGSFDAKKFEKVTSEEVEAFVKASVKPGMSHGGLMGIVMAKYRGKIDGKTMSEIVKKHTS